MKILFVCMTNILSSASAMHRNRAVMNGLIDIGYNVDYLMANQNKLTYSKNEDEILKRINLFSTDKDTLYDAITGQTEEKGNFLRDFVCSTSRAIYHKINLFDRTIYTARRVNLDILPQKSYDLIISSSDPKSSHIAVLKLKRDGLRAKRWIQYWGDPLSGDMARNDIIPEFIARNTERKIMREADKVVFVSPFTLEYEKKIHNNLADIMSFVPIPYDKEKLYEIPKNDCIIGFFGDYSSHIRNIIPFYNACKSLTKSHKTIIAGNSDLAIDSTDSVQVIPRGDISGLFNKCGILVCLLNKCGTQIPGKIYHYAATNIPILVIIDGDRGLDIQQYLNKYRRYEFCENEENAIREKLIEILSDPKSNKTACKAFNRISVTEEIIKGCI